MEALWGILERIGPLRVGDLDRDGIFVGLLAENHLKSKWKGSSRPIPQYLSEM